MFTVKQSETVPPHDPCMKYVVEPSIKGKQTPSMLDICGIFSCEPQAQAQANRCI